MALPVKISTLSVCFIIKFLSCGNKFVYALQEGVMWKFGTCWKAESSLFLLRIITKQLRVHVWVLQATNCSQDHWTGMFACVSHSKEMLWWRSWIDFFCFLSMLGMSKCITPPIRLCIISTVRHPSLVWLLRYVRFITQEETFKKKVIFHLHLI